VELAPWLWIGLPVLAFVVGWAIGTTSILMTWALESTASMFVPASVLPPLEGPAALSQALQHLRPRGDLDASAASVVVLDEQLATKKPHIAGLARTTELMAGVAPRVRARPHGWVPLDSIALLQGKVPRAMWNRAAVLALALSSSLGTAVALAWAAPGPAAVPADGRVALVVGAATVLSAVGGQRVTACATTAGRWGLWLALVAVVAVGAGAAASWLADASTGRAVVTGLVAVGPSVFTYWANYALFRDASFKRLKHPLTPVLEAVGMALLGRDTAKALHEERMTTLSPTG
jgi:hypothetical protein